jgi:hypothetical protein
MVLHSRARPRRAACGDGTDCNTSHTKQELVADATHQDQHSIEALAAQVPIRRSAYPFATGDPGEIDALFPTC